MARKVKIVSTVLATDSAGNVVDAMPVRDATGPTLNAAGKYVDPIAVEIDETGGSPVRYVDGLVTTDSAGRVVPITPITGVGVPPEGFLFLTETDADGRTYYLIDEDGYCLLEEI